MNTPLQPNLYLAGPYGFTEAGRCFYYEKLVPLCVEAGFLVLDPWKLTDEALIRQVVRLPFGPKQREAWRQLSTVIGQNNRAAIDDAQAVCACLDGSDVDSGTAAEIGYAFSRGMPIIGYRDDIRQAGDNIGVPVNLQVYYFIEASGGTIVGSLERLAVELKHLRDRLCAH